MSENSSDLQHHSLFIFVELIDRSLDVWTQYDHKNKTLWNVFKIVFRATIKNQFERLTSDSRLLKLLLHLKKHEVWIRKNSLKDYSQALIKARNKKKSVRWTENEYNKILNNEKDFNFRFIIRMLKIDWEKKKLHRKRNSCLNYSDLHHQFWILQINRCRLVNQIR